MEIIRTARPIRKTADLDVWYCEGCGVVHLSVDKKVIDVTRQQFSEFAEQVAGINYSGWAHPRNGVIDLESLSTRYTEQ